MKSIRTFLVIVLLATMTLIIFLSALHGYRSSMQQTELLFDEELHDLVDLLDEFPGVNTKVMSGDTPKSGDLDNTIAFQIWDNGELSRRSANAPDTPFGPFQAGYHESNFSGHRWRTLARRSTNTDRWIFVAEHVDNRFRVAEEIILEAVTPIILGLPVAGVLIWLIVGYGMRPLEQLAVELSTKAGDDLTPLREDQTPAELAQVIRSTNDLLSRLEASFERERRFTADAAHELRTPISVLKVHLHNLAQELPPDNANIAHLKDGIDRMNHLVEQILLLHQTAPDQLTANFTVLDLHLLARDVVSKHYGDFAAKNQQIELVGDVSRLLGDPFTLETLLQNLLGNAGKYTPEGGRIQVSVQPGEQSVILKVEDSGPGIPPDEYERVFDRFHRVGGDRHASTEPGCGLGLAIVQHIAQLHQAHITLGTSSFDNGLSVCVRFPAAAAQAGNVHD